MQDARCLKVKIYRIIILHVLYGCKTWSLTLREERRLRVFVNRVLRRIFGPKTVYVNNKHMLCILDNDQLDTCFILQYVYYNPRALYAHRQEVELY